MARIIDIPEEYLPAFEADPTVAWMAYGDAPLGAEQPYFDFNAVATCVDTERKNPFNSQTMVFDPKWRCAADDHNLRFMHIDLGQSRDACGAAMCHVGGWVNVQITKKGEDARTYTEREMRPVFIIDVMARFTAPPSGEIDFADPKEFVFEIDARGFPIALITFDRWQSVESIQQLRKRGFKVDNLSLDRTTSYPALDMRAKGGIRREKTAVYSKYASLAPWTTAYEALRQSRLRLPFYLPVTDIAVSDDFGNALDKEVQVTHIQREMLGATFDAKTMKVVERPGGSIDMLEAVVGATFNASTNVTDMPVTIDVNLQKMMLAEQLRTARSTMEKNEIKRAAKQLLAPDNRVPKKDMPQHLRNSLATSVFEDGGESIFEDEIPL